MHIPQAINCITGQFGVSTRAKLWSEQTVTKWATWFLVPVPGYVEASSYGPCPVREVEWIEINPIVTVPIGRLVKPRIDNHTFAIVEYLNREDIAFAIHEGLIKVPLH